MVLARLDEPSPVSASYMALCGDEHTLEYSPGGEIVPPTPCPLIKQYRARERSEVRLLADDTSYVALT